MLSLFLHIGTGALLGAGLGYFGQCSSGTCPLTSTWWRGALYGSAMGLLLFFSSAQSAPARGTTAPPVDSGAVNAPQPEATSARSGTEHPGAGHS